MSSSNFFKDSEAYWRKDSGMSRKAATSAIVAAAGGVGMIGYGFNSIVQGDIAAGLTEVVGGTSLATVFGRLALDSIDDSLYAAQEAAKRENVSNEKK